MKKEIIIKLTEAEANQRIEELFQTENVQLAVKVKDGQKKLEEINQLAEQLKG